MQRPHLPLQEQAAKRQRRAEAAYVRILELAMRRERELSEVESLMRGEDGELFHMQRSTWDRWGLEVLREHGLMSLSTREYEAAKLTRFVE
jgi:hypothetical protein